MALENTPLVEEITEIFGGGPNPVNFVWECVISLPDRDVRANKVVSIDINRDYLNNFGDEVVIKITVPHGFYNSEILKNRDKLFFELTRKPVSENGEGTSPTEIYTKLYKALPLRESSGILSGNIPQAQDSEAMDLMNLVEVEFQLLEPVLKNIAIHQTGGIFRETVPANAVRYLLTTVLKGMDLPKEESVLGVDMVSPDNKKPSAHVIIPHGTNLEDIPTLVQEEWGGIYNTGIGSYLQDNIWYLWPQYRLNRCENEKRTARIYNLPPNRYPGIERSYRMNGEELVILSTGEARHLDQSYGEQYNQGTGTRFTLGKRIMDGFGEAKENKFTINKAENNIEINSVFDTDFVYSPVSNKRISNNLFSEASRLSRRLGSTLTLVWENSRIELIYPGMPVKFHYLENNEIKELNGVVMSAHHLIYDDKPGPVQRRHKTNTAITLFIEKTKD